MGGGEEGVGIFLKIFIYLFYFWLHRVLVAACGLFIAARGLLFSCGTWVPECVGSVVAARGLSCPAACGILVPCPGIEPPSPALEGRFLTSGPPGKSQGYGFKSTGSAQEEGVN